ncbi:hypothetical protein BC827DRAFT_1153828 [Russula dissimulans]|nr:hypothetical protein BC827DRAFT_1153828 [Russula dissimulans]
MSSATSSEGFSGVADGLVLATASLSQCLRDWQLVLDIAGATLIFYDWFLTSSDEANIVTCLRGVAILSSECESTFSTRSPLPAADYVDQYQVILAARTWAIWERSRPALIFLVVFAIVRSWLVVSFHTSTYPDGWRPVYHQ